MLYLFLQSIVPTVPASFLAFAEKPIYSWYAAAPRLTAMSAVEDQQVAGAVMKIGGATIIWSVIIVIFFRWYRDGQEPAPSNPPLRRHSPPDRAVRVRAISFPPSSPASPDASL
jgi:cytochrome c oxidase assembly factor CtaG